MGVIRKALASPPVARLTSPHHVDHYLEFLHPMLTAEAVRGRVVEVRRETGKAVTVVIKPNGAWRGSRAGQHIEFGIDVEGRRRIRVFTLTNVANAKDGLISVSVKVHPDGFVSRHLNDGHLQVGTIVYLSAASGDFVLPDPVPPHIAMITGGSGITPAMAMVRTLAAAGHTGRISFLHYARSRDDEMFHDELDALAARPNVDVTRVYTREPAPGATLAGHLTAGHLAAAGITPSQSPTWVCGPAGLIAAATDLFEKLNGIDQLNVEYFKVPEVDLTAADATGKLTFEESGEIVENSGDTILRQAELAGLKPEFGCRMGICNTCAARKAHGAVRNVVTDEVSANTDEIVKICVEVPVGDVAVNL